REPAGRISQRVLLESKEEEIEVKDGVAESRIRNHRLDDLRPWQPRQRRQFRFVDLGAAHEFAASAGNPLLPLPGRIENAGVAVDYSGGTLRHGWLDRARPRTRAFFTPGCD